MPIMDKAYCYDISVVIPVYNAEKYLSNAINSVLSQEGVTVEIIVINDGSTDDSETVAFSYGTAIRYFYQPNSGPSAARNTGILQAKNEFIAFLDADDIYPDQFRLIRSLYKIKQMPELDVVIGKIQVQHITQDDKVFINVGLPRFVFLFGAILCRKIVFSKVGFLNESLPNSEDFDWMLKLRENSIFFDLINETVLYYRQHGLNMSSGLNFSNSHLLKILHASIVSRRRKGINGSLPSFFQSLMDSKE